MIIDDIMMIQKTSYAERDKSSRTTRRKDGDDEGREEEQDDDEKRSRKKRMNDQIFLCCRQIPIPYSEKIIYLEEGRAKVLPLPCLVAHVWFEN